MLEEGVEKTILKSFSPYLGIVQFGRTLALGARGQGFKSLFLDQSCGVPFCTGSQHCVFWADTTESGVLSLKIC